MLGYLGEPAPQGEWLRTGDLGHFEDGFLVLHGRKKHQFITAYGRNVNPEWVESELVQQLPIAQAWLHGEALPANVAVLVPRYPNTPDAQLQAAVDAVPGAQLRGIGRGQRRRPGARSGAEAVAADSVPEADAADSVPEASCPGPR